MGLIAQHIRAPDAVFILAVDKEQRFPADVIGAEFLGKERCAVVFFRVQRVKTHCEFVRLGGREDEDLVLTVAVEVGIGEGLFIGCVDLGEALYPVRAVVNLRVAPREVQPAVPVGTVGVGVILGRDMPLADADLVFLVGLERKGPAPVGAEAVCRRVVEPVIEGNIVGGIVELQADVAVAVEVIVAGCKAVLRRPAARVAIRTPNLVTEVGDQKVLLPAVIPQKVDAAHAAVILPVLIAV